MKLLKGCTPLLLLLTLSGTMAFAQNGVDAYFGLGTATDSSNHQSIDTFGDGTLYSTPSLNGVFGKAGADLMITPHLGVGGAADFRFSQAGYAGLNYRPTFYDFYGIYEPGLKSKRIAPQFELGLGGVNMKYYYPQSYCDQFAGCSSSNSYVESSNHFQVRFGVGLNIYLTEHVFVRPQVDVHWVNNFFQFGSSWVPEYSAAIGYHFGEH